MKRVTALLLLAAAAWQTPAIAGGLTCTGPNETLLSWPAENPLWEMCWLPPNRSSGPQGSGLEIRNVHYRGIPVLKTMHSPLLFAEYTSSTCYRDWKDSPASFIAEPQVRNQLGTTNSFTATTSCDRSNDPIASYGRCPFSLPGHSNADCFNGVAIEDNGDHVVLTNQYDASWYAYSSRVIFYTDGSFTPIFGFGNFDGTGSATTHWHHNYWRLDFDIDGPENDVISINDVVQNTEFTSLRDLTGGPGGTERTWEVRDTVTGRGYRVLPSAADYVSPTNQSGRGFHMTDVIGTIYKPNEYGDLSNNPLGSCQMNHGNLANGENLAGPTGDGTDVVLYYRVAVRDQTGADTMQCKSAGPMFQPLGNWGGEPDPSADLSIVFDPATVPPTPVGGTVNLTIDVENAGPDDATDVAVEITLPSEFAFQSGRATAANKLQDYVRGSDWTCVDDLGTVTCALAAAVAAGTPAPSLVIEATVDAEAAPGTVSVSATVVALEADPDAANNEASIDVEIEEKPGPDDGIYCDGFEQGGDGSCGGGPVTPDDVVVVPNINFSIPNTINGASINWINEDVVIGDPSTGYDINLYAQSASGLSIWWDYSPTTSAGVAISSSSADMLVLQSGDTVGPASTFSRTNFAMPTWAAGANGYLGFRFNCSALPEAPASGVCYGYLHLQTTAPLGFPATFLSYAYNKAGDPITIP